MRITPALACLVLLAGARVTSPATKQAVGLATRDDGKQLYFHDIVKILNEQLGTTPQNVIFVFDVCGSGGAIDAISDAQNGLKAPVWSVATSTKDAVQRSKQYHVYTVKEDGPTKNPAGSLQSTLSPHDKYDGFGPQWIRSVKEDATRKVKDAFEHAKTRDIWGPDSTVADYKMQEDPRYLSKGGAAADDATLRSGTSSNHAILFFGHDGDPYDFHLVRELNNRLRDVHKYERSEIQLLLGHYVTAPRYDADEFVTATTPNFEAAVKKLKQPFADKPDKEQLLLYFGGHGKYAAVAEKKKEDPQPAQPGQGGKLDAADPTLPLEVGPEFWQTLFEDLGVPGADRPDFFRSRQPTVTLSTYAEYLPVNLAQDLTVVLRVDPQTTIPLATFDLSGDPGPHQYEEPIPDPTLLELANVVGTTPPSSLTLEFQFTDGASWVQLYTEDDFWLDVDPAIDLWGAGLTATIHDGEGDAVVEAAVPDDFQCYETRRQSFAGPPVTLHDQFGSVAGVFVQRPERLCAPADVNGATPDAPTHPEHLAGYRVRDPFVKVSGVRVFDRFGALFLDVLKRDRLLVPSVKSLTATPPLPASFAVDHFQCYTVRPSRGTPRFVPISGVTVTDQLGTASVTLARPVRLCAPVDKNGEAPEAWQHVDHLLCYKTRGSMFPSVTAFVNNQLGDQQMSLIRRMELCLPAVKTLP